MKFFPTLYQKTNTGAIQYWKIRVAEICQCQVHKPEGREKYTMLSADEATGAHSDLDDTKFAGMIVIEYGQLNTEKPQITSDLISEGKSPGKKNATTAWEQSVKEAEATWSKRKKGGYVESIDDALAGKVDAIIEGGIFPMLAQKFKDHPDKVIYPCFVQPKLDGMRCIAVINDGKCTLWSRTRKRINSVPHIVAELEETFEGQTITIDGELYNHDLKHDFDRIMSLARKKEPCEGHTDIQYHVYDKITNKNFNDRTNELMNDFSQCPFVAVRLVLTGMAYNDTDITRAFAGFRKQGYEGCMVRNAEGMYLVDGRSYDLLKVKEFIDAEFEIVGIEEGDGKLQGHVGSFTCKTADGAEFGVKMEGEQAKLKEYFENHSLWKGKQLTVTYQRITIKTKVPLHPVGLRIRELE